jgi:hypothetical protein
MKNIQLNSDCSSDYSNVSREVRVVEYEDDIVKPKWIADLVPPKKESEFPVVLVRDPATNRYFRVRENQLTYDVKGKNKDVVSIFVGRRAFQ